MNGQRGYAGEDCHQPEGTAEGEAPSQDHRRGHLRQGGGLEADVLLPFRQRLRDLQVDGGVQGAVQEGPRHGCPLLPHRVPRMAAGVREGEGPYARLLPLLPRDGDPQVAQERADAGRQGDPGGEDRRGPAPGEDSRVRELPREREPRHPFGLGGRLHGGPRGWGHRPRAGLIVIRPGPEDSGQTGRDRELPYRESVSGLFSQSVPQDLVLHPHLRPALGTGGGEPGPGDLHHLPVAEAASPAGPVKEPSHVAHEDRPLGGVVPAPAREAGVVPAAFGVGVLLQQSPGFRAVLPVQDVLPGLGVAGTAHETGAYGQGDGVSASLAYEVEAVSHMCPPPM